MARVQFGGTAADVVLDKYTGRPVPNTEIEVRDADTDALLTDLTAPPGYSGLAFPAGRARADVDGLVTFLGPDGFTGDVEIRAVTARGAGAWVRVPRSVPAASVDALRTRVTAVETSKADKTDARFMDQRTPTDGSVTDAKVAAGAGIAVSKLAGLAPVATSGSASDLTAGTVPDARLPGRLSDTTLSATYGRGNPAVLYVDPAGSDTANGLTMSTAKATIAAATAGLPVAGGIVILTPRAIFNMGTSSLDLDISRVRLIGDCTILQWSAAPTAGYAVHVFASQDYTEQDKAWGTALSGIIIKGGATTAEQFPGVGLRIGHITYLHNSTTRLADGGVEGFATCVEFIRNAWRVHLDHFNVRFGNIGAAAGLVNFGENMAWSNSMLNDGVTITLDTGEWHFSQVSFDNAPLVINGDCAVFCDGCHFENPGGGANDYRFISLTHVSAECHLVNCLLVVSISTTFQRALFNVDSMVTARGLVARNLRLVQWSTYAPENVDKLRTLVAGGGRAVLDGLTMNDGGNGYVFSEAMNRLYNGDAELGNTTGWTITGTATLTADTTAGNFNRGTQGFRFSAAAGQSGVLTQGFPVEAGKWMLLQHWRKTATTGTATLSVQARFYTKDGGTQVGASIGYSSQANATNWKNICAPIPKGATWCQLRFDVVGGTGIADFWFDDAIANVV